MIRAIFTLALTAFTASQIAGAAPGPSAADGNFGNVKDTEGLCVAEHREKTYYKMGHCKTVFESLIHTEEPKNCVNKKLEEVRKKLIGEYKAPASPAPAPGGAPQPATSVSAGGFSCTNTTHNKNIYDYAKDPKMFAYLMLVLGSAMAAEPEAKWDVKREGGLLGIDPADFDKPEYACGCDITNSKSRGGTPAGESPGTKDGHHNLQCAIYMILHHASIDGYLFTGTKPEKKEDEKDAYKGGARKFEALRSHGYTDGDPSVEKNPRLRYITEKLKNFCDKASFVQKWTPELVPDTDLDGMRNLGDPAGRR